MNIFGKKFNKEQLENATGRITQVAGSRRYELTEGKSRGVRAVDVNTGSGFTYTILPDRAMDISLCSYKGVNLVYHGIAGETHPAYYNLGNEWMQSFFAGLVTTCGLQNLADPCVEDGEQYGLHGRISNTPASRFNDLSRWEGENYVLEFEGVMQEATLFGSKLVMKRNIKSIAGDKKLTICDTVENIGIKDTPFVILYHINAGFPLLDKNSRLVISSKEVLGYDKKSTENIDKYDIFDSPKDHFEEENFLHKMKSDETGRYYAGIINDDLNSGLGLYISANSDALPYISEWKMLGNKDYVVAIEPVNTKVANRKQLRKEGILPVLKPKEKKTMSVEIGVLDGKNDISAFEDMVGNCK